MAKQPKQQLPVISTVVSIDMRRGALHYYTMLGEDRASIAHHVKNFSGIPFTAEFYLKLREALAGFTEDIPSETVRKVALVLPDEAVALDTLRLPAMRSPRVLQNAVETKLATIYKNRAELEARSHMVEKNKQYCTFRTLAVQKSILEELRTACGENRLFAECIGFSSASAVAAVSELMPKWKSESYLFLDLKDVYSRFIFVAGGQPVAFYTLPFGLEFLIGPKQVPEDLLFDHTLGELAVLNAQEKARAKKLTLLRELNGSEEDEEDTDNTPEEVGEAVSPTASEAAATDSREKLLARRTPRKLPLFMQRPQAETPEGIAIENFRVFLKWGLSLLRGNPQLAEMVTPKFIAVNLPSEHSYILEAYAPEEHETGLPLVRFDGADGDSDLAASLELFGGLGFKGWHPSLRF